MAVSVSELTTVEAPIGDAPDDVVTVGDSFARSFAVQEADPPCAFADFTGYVPAFEVLDGAGAVLVTGTVLPSPGDVTGTFAATLTTADTITLGEGVFHYRLRIVQGAVTKTLFCGPFTVTECKAAA